MIPIWYQSLHHVVSLLTARLVAGPLKVLCLRVRSMLRPLLVHDTSSTNTHRVTVHVHVTYAFRFADGTGGTSLRGKQDCIRCTSEYTLGLAALCKHIRAWSYVETGTHTLT